MRGIVPAALAALILALTARDTGTTPDGINVTIAGVPNDTTPDVTIAGSGGYER